MPHSQAAAAAGAGGSDSRCRSVTRLASVEELHRTVFAQRTTMMHFHPGRRSTLGAGPVIPVEHRTPHLLPAAPVHSIPPSAPRSGGCWGTTSICRTSHRPASRPGFRPTAA